MIKQLVKWLIWTLLWTILGVAQIALTIVLYDHDKWIGGTIDLALSVISIFWVIVSIVNVIRNVKGIEMVIQINELKQIEEIPNDLINDDIKDAAERFRDKVISTILVAARTILINRQIAEKHTQVRYTPERFLKDLEDYIQSGYVYCVEDDVKALITMTRGNLRGFVGELKENSFEVDVKDYGKIAVVAEDVINELFEKYEERFKKEHLNG